MGRINWGRVVLGGLVAGVVLNVVDWLVHGVWLMEDWSAVMQGLGANEIAGGTMALYVIWDFILGIFIVWLYAAIRPRFGPGPKTAMIAGVATWFLIGLLHAIGEAPMGLFPTRLMVISVVAALVAAVLAGVAGGWLYQEGAQPSAPAM